MKDLKPHKLSKSLIPPINEKQRESFFEDINKNGQNVAGWLYQGDILDGNLRYEACKKCEREFQYYVFEGTEEQAINLVISLNKERKQFTLGQLAAMAALQAKLLKKDPIQNLSRKGEVKRFSPDYVKKEKNLNKQFHNQTMVKVAKSIGVGTASTMKAMVLLNNARDLFDKVFAGEMQTNSAYNLYRQKNGTTRKPTKETAFNIDTFKRDIVIPDCFASEEQIKVFIKAMNQHGWILEMQFRDGKVYANWFGNGYVSYGHSWGKAHAEFDMKRAVVVAAKEKLDKVNTQVA
jgi:hypothetical protein